MSFDHLNQNPGVPWPATDALGRSLPLALQVGPPRSGRTVGIFYFLWLEKQHAGPFDVTKIVAADPEALSKQSSPPWGGPEETPHHWGESIFGYYLSQDEWVIRKHAQMLTDAGIDTLIFDTTNAVTYRDVYFKLAEVFTAIRAEGAGRPSFASCSIPRRRRRRRKFTRSSTPPATFPIYGSAGRVNLL